MKRLFDSDFPFSPERLPVYYGWIILPAAIIGVIASIPGQTAGFSAFTEPLLGVSGLSRLQLSTCYFTGTFISGLLLPRAGNLLDSWGVRPMACITCIGLSLVLLLMSCVDLVVVTLFGSSAANTLAFAIVLTGGILGLRFFGQGMLPIISNTLVGRWFIQRRGRAVAVMSVVQGLAFSSSPLVLYQLVELHGWAHTWVAMALIIGIGGTCLFWLVHRESPESCGIAVDGTHYDSEDEDEDEDEDEGDNAEHEMTGDTAKVAIRSRAFWACLLPTASIGLTMTAVTFHIVAYGGEVGVSEEMAVKLFLPISIVGIPTGFFSAWLIRRVGIVRLLQLMCLAQMGGFMAIQHLDHTTGYILTAIGMGIACGLFGPVQTIGLPQYFGRLHLGAINGRFYSLCVMASALGPALFAASHRFTGSFFPALYACLGPPLVGLLLTAGLKRHAAREVSKSSRT
jgi:MFS transporter, OFA family, oxalate/formate antiporter